MKLSDFDYDLPPERIAQTPTSPRDTSRLLILHRETQQLEHRHFYDLPEYLRTGDVLVLNQTRVIAARLYAHKAETGGKVEILLLNQLDEYRWLAMVGGRRVLTGTELLMDHDDTNITARVEEVTDGAQRIIAFSQAINTLLPELGEMPLPPYITKPLQNPDRYQTVYARDEGSAAAPTAGLHFTPELLQKLQKHGVQVAYCTLHVGLDTFAPVRVEDIHQHKIHREYAELTLANANMINMATNGGGRVIPVGTTSARTLESAAIRAAADGLTINDPASIQQTLRQLDHNQIGRQRVVALAEKTDLYITPGYSFRAVDAMITNFHLPKSTLLMMLSALVSRDVLLQTYQQAIALEYRFYSFGDAMLIL